MADTTWDHREKPPLGDDVTIVEHDVKWHGSFRHERRLLIRALGDRVVSIDHVGSTSVAGLAAKPVIDILVSVSVYPLSNDLLAALGDVGYQYRGEDPIGGGQFFRTEPRTRHVRVVAANDTCRQNYLLFRDYLREHANVRAEYATLKRRLAQRYRTDRHAYTAGKSEFIQAVLSRARAEL